MNILNKTIKSIVGIVILTSSYPLLAQDWDIDFIESYLQEKVELQKQAVGVSIALINEDGIEFVSYGKASIDGSPVDENSVYEIGSITKVFTATVLAEMVLNNELNLEDSVDQFLTAQVEMPKRNGEEISLLNLSQQNSGLPRLPGNLQMEDPLNPYASYTVEQMYEFLDSYELTRDIGETYEYSNLGVGLLGHALALKAEMNYEEMLAEIILAPLGMTDTSISLSDEQLNRLALGHDTALNQVPNWDLPTLAGAGALRSTASDMAKFISANLGLTSSSLDSAFLLAHSERSPTTSPGLAIGLNWHISTDKGTEIIWHNGGTGGYRTFAGFVKDKNIGVVVLANTGNSLDDLGMHLLESSYPLNVYREGLSSDEINTDDYQKYTGLYQLAPNFDMNVTLEDESLFVQATGQAKLPIFQESENEFFLRVVDAQISFIAKSNGEIESLILHQGGNDVPGPRVGDAKNPEVKVELTLAEDILSQYVGEYTMENIPGIMKITLEDGQLYTQLTGQPAFPLFAESETRFFLKVVEAQLEFSEIENSVANTATLFQAGQEVSAHRNE